MSKGVNKVILVGNLGQDPETKYLPSGSAVTNISIATSESWKDKQTGQQQERTEWHRICFFNRLAEVAGEYLRKGSKVYIEGSLRTRKWQDKSGQDRYTTEIIASEMQMLDSRADNAGQQAPQQQQAQPQQQQAPSTAGQSSSAQHYQNQVPAPTPPPQQSAPQPQNPGMPGKFHDEPVKQGFDNFDDDLPF